MDSWKNVFNDASARLWNASNGQLKIGKVSVYRRAFSKKDSADVWILRGNGSSFVNGVSKLGIPGFHTTLFADRHRSNKPSYRGGFSLVHELGHYAFGLQDQYQGAFVPMALKSTWTAADLSAVQKLPFAVAPTIMSGGGGLGSIATEFDSAFDVNKGSQVGGNWWMTENWIVNRESSWETLGKFEWKGVKVFPKLPQGSPEIGVPPGDTNVDWRVIPDDSRLAIVIDRSGSMSTENRMSLAKLGAVFMTSLTVDRHVVTSFLNGISETNVFPADNLGVIAFDNAVNRIFPLKEVDGDGVARNDAKEAISKIDTGGGTAIGNGVQDAVTMFSEGGAAGAQENIIVLSDGADNSSTVSMADAAQHALERGARIFSIALGSGADATGLLSMANATGGKFFQAADGLGLLDIYARIYGELRGGGIMEALASLVVENSTAETVVPVDSLSEEVTFSAAAPEPGFEMQLVTPSGKRITQSSPADGVVLQKSANSVIYRVSKPSAGNWKLAVTAPKSNTGRTYRYNLMANAVSPAVSVVPMVASKEVKYPEPALITCLVTAGSPVTGVSVAGEITGPNGGLGRVDLFDDGAAIHGDKVAGDGIYSGYYSAFPADGVYSFVVKAVNVTGRTAAGEGENANFVTRSVPVSPFTRYGVNTVSVNGVSGSARTGWVRVDALSVARAASNAATGSLQLRCTFNTEQASFVPGTDGIKVSVDNNEIVIPSASLRPTRVPGVYTVSDPSRGLSATLTTQIGGTSKNELIMALTKFNIGSFDFDASTSVNVVVGRFNQTAVLSNRADANKKSIVYVSESNFSSGDALYVDGLTASIATKQNKTDALRLVVTYQGTGFKYDPVADDLSLRLGQFLISVPKGRLTVGTGSNATKATGSVAVGGGVASVTVDLQKHIVSINGAKLNLGSMVLPTSELALQLGSITKTCTITSKALVSPSGQSLSY